MNAVLAVLAAVFFMAEIRMAAAQHDGYAFLCPAASASR